MEKETVKKINQLVDSCKKQEDGSIMVIYFNEGTYFTGNYSPKELSKAFAQLIVDGISEDADEELEVFVNVLLNAMYKVIAKCDPASVRLLSAINSMMEHAVKKQAIRCALMETLHDIIAEDNEEDDNDNDADDTDKKEVEDIIDSIKEFVEENFESIAKSKKLKAKAKAKTKKEKK